MTTRSWVDWVNVILGVWLITSPWLLPVAAGESAADWSSWSVGAAIVTIAFFAMYKPSVWGGAVQMVLGAWLIASPWILGFASASAATLNAVLIGLLVSGYAAWAMRIDIDSDHDPAYSIYQHRTT